MYVLAHCQGAICHNCCSLRSSISCVFCFASRLRFTDGACLRRLLLHLLLFLLLLYFYLSFYSIDASLFFVTGSFVLARWFKWFHAFRSSYTMTIELFFSSLPRTSIKTVHTPLMATQSNLPSRLHSIWKSFFFFYFVFMNTIYYDFN